MHILNNKVMNMQNFTRSNVASMQDEMIEVLNKYGFKNVQFKTDSARFSSSECTFKLTGKIAGTKTRAESELARHAAIDGVDPDKTGPKGEKLIEYHSRKRKYPYIYASISGKWYKCGPDRARNMFPA